MVDLNYARRDGILSYVARAAGARSVAALLEQAVSSPVVPTVCIECYTLSDSHNIALADGWCECCHGQHVKSVLVVGEIL